MHIVTTIIILILLIISIKFISKTEHMTTEEILKSINTKYDENISVDDMVVTKDLTLGGTLSSEMFYPVNSIFLSTLGLTQLGNGTPSAVLGFGKWERIDDGFLFCVPTSKPSNVYDGSPKIDLFNMPSHNHTLENVAVMNSRATDNCIRTCDHVGKSNWNVGKFTSKEGGGINYFPRYDTIIAWIRVS